MSEITPKNNTELFGHEDAEAMLQREFASGKLAHGWILYGPRGIGKATLAYRFARTLLSGELPDEMHSDHPVFRRVEAGSHSDILVVEQRYDEKKEELVRDISVEQAREIAQFLSLTPGEGRWRVVIVDSADALNVNGANAILKILEEPPPQTVLLLISHNPGRLLPTIRSRCRSLRLHAPDKDQFISIMRHVHPAIDSGELKALAQLSGMSPGVALDLHKQGAVELYGQLVELMSSLPALDTLGLHGFAESIGGSKSHASWQLLTRLLLCLTERIALQASQIEPDAISDEESRLLAAMSALHPAHIWAEKWQQVADQFMLAERLHLDYKQVIIAFFHSIPMKEGFQIGSLAA